MIPPVINDELLPQTTPEQKAIIASFSKIQFDKYIFKKHDNIPQDLDLRGAIVIERDTNHRGFLHFLLWIAQKIYAFFFSKKVDANLGHTSIIMGRGLKPNDLIYNHSSVSYGIGTSKLNHKAHKQVTEIIIYVPKSQELKDLLFEYAKQTCHDSRGKYGNVPKEQMGKFSTGDMLGSVFHGLKKHPSEEVLKRTANTVTDLLMGQRLLNEQGKKSQNLFCTPYVASLLVGTHLIQSLKPGEKELLLEKEDGSKRSRREVSSLIYHSIKTKIPTNSLSRAYWNNKISYQNLRFLTSAQFARILDKTSTLK